jgi:hypothetical protein
MSGGVLASGDINIKVTFNMSGTAEISDNTTASDGAGVRIYCGTTFNMSRGRITGNIANADGGGVTCRGAYHGL